MNPESSQNPNPNSIPSGNRDEGNRNSSNPPTDDRRHVNRNIPETSTAADVAMVDHYFSNLDAIRLGLQIIPTEPEAVSVSNLNETISRTLLNIEIGDVDHLFSNHARSLFRDRPQEEQGRWYLFSKEIRKVACGCWKPVGPSKAFYNNNGVKICEKKCVVYHQGHPPTRTKTNWTMIEYTTALRLNRLFSGIYPELDRYVICKIFRESDPDVIRELDSLASSDEDEIPSSVGSNEEDPNEQVEAVCDQLALMCNQEHEPEQVGLPVQNPDAIFDQETNPRTEIVQFENNFPLQSPLNDQFHRIVRLPVFPRVPVYPPPQAVVWVPVQVYPPPDLLPAQQNPPPPALIQYYDGRNVVFRPLPGYPQPLLPPVQGNPPPLPPNEYYTGRNMAFPGLPVYRLPLLPPVPVSPPRQTPLQLLTGGNLVSSSNLSLPTYNLQGTQSSGDGDIFENLQSGSSDDDLKDTADSLETQRKGG